MHRSARAALTLFGAMALLPAWAVAQQGATIAGRVTSDAGQPLANASVFLQGTKYGALTNDDGRYSFTVSATHAANQSATLTARLIGFHPVSAAITLAPGSITHDFVLVTMPTQLQAVVTTALGIQKLKSQLGTATQQLSSAELNTTRTQNFVDQLEGKVSGVTISSSGVPGASTKIVIRGSNSINGNNTPLFVVDGVPMANDDRGSSPGNGSLSNATNTGIDLGSTIGDINPDDIASITILKGPNAAALYGSRAANGAIVIVTKHGANSDGKMRTELNTLYTFDHLGQLIDWQNEYGQGSGGNFSYVDGKGSGINDGYDQSFGPKLDGRLIDQFFGKQQPWVAHPDNVSSFFNMGHTWTSTLAVSGGTDNANARLSVGNSNISGVVPNNSFHNVTGSMAGTLKLGDRFTATASMLYGRENAHNRPGVGYNTSILEQFFWFGRQVDMSLLKAKLFNDDGSLYNWNSNFHNNPYWLQYYNPEHDQRDHIFATATGTYNITDWLNAKLRAGQDYYNWNIKRDFGAGNIQYSSPNYAGAFSNTLQSNRENNADLLLNATKAVTSNLTLNGLLGASRRYSEFNTSGIYTAGISVPNVYNVANAAIVPTPSGQIIQRQVNSLYGSASFTWKNFWTVEATGRNDWSSTLPRKNNAYFYPSVNSSIVLTDAIPSLKSKTLSYLKLRGAFARVGNDASPYQLLTTYVGSANKFGSLPQYSVNTNIANENLKPEITTSDEFGAELGFLDDRITLDASVYKKDTRNQIVSLVVSPASGFNTQTINAGEISNKGFEALLTAIPVRTENFEWNTTFNFSLNRSKVVSLTEGLSTVVLGGEWGATVEARVGQPYGAIVGPTLLRDSAGNVLLSNGLAQHGPSAVLGNINPDWIGGWNNQFRYKQLTLSFLVDIHQGGKLFSISNMWCEAGGTCTQTLVGREQDWNKPGIVATGIDQATGLPNTVNVTSERWFQSLAGVIQQFTYDASYIKLREVRLGYALPPSIASRLYAQSVKLSLFGRNLLTHKNIPNIDPEFTYSTGNFPGIEFAQLPPNRTFGLNLQIIP